MSLSVAKFLSPLTKAIVTFFLFLSYRILGDFMYDITKLNPCELIALASSLAISIGQQISPEEAGILSDFFSALGDNLGIFSSN